MKIGCITISEQRSSIWGISLASFITQTYENAVLHAYVDNVNAYAGVLDRLTGFGKASDNVSVVGMGITGKRDRMRAVMIHTRAPALLGADGVPTSLDVGIRSLFEEDCDIVTIWDDDDFAPIDRLQRTASEFKRFTAGIGALDKMPIVASYRSGWMINLRTFEGRFLQLDHFWGGCLAFNKQAWLIADGFAPGSNPGYDRSFVTRLHRRSAVGSLDLTQDRVNLPIAFCHDKNVASFCVGDDVFDCAEQTRAVLPPLVRREVLAAKQLMMDKRVFPPGTGDRGRKDAL